MEELKRTSKLVLKILREDNKAREDDLYLYEQTLDMFIPGISKRVKLIHDLMRHKRLPRWETMRRARQKVQADNPKLTNVDTMIHRLDKEKEYVEFARS